MPKVFNESLIIDSDLYDNLLDLRGLKNITINISKRLPEDFNPESYAYSTHVWSKRDRLIKLANIYYGNYKYWYIIGFFNNKPIDHLYKLGETIKIPSNPETIEAILEFN